MAKLTLTGMITAPPVVRQKKDFQTKELVVDKEGQPVIERFFSALDLHSDNTDIYKIKFNAAQEEKVKSFLRQSVEIMAEVGLYNKFAFYNLEEIKKAA